MKRWIVIGTVLAALGGSIVIAGCGDGNACDLSQCSYSMNGNTYACNECGIGNEIYNCDTVEGCLDCGVGCTGNCISNCAEQNCNDCDVSVPSCGLTDACPGGEWVTVELVHPDDYTAISLYANYFSGTEASEAYTCSYVMRLDFEDKYQEIYVDISIVYEGAVIGTAHPYLSRYDDKIYNFTCDVEKIDSLLSLSVSECYELITVRIDKITANRYVSR